jgi:hypothetical protein
MIPPAGQPKIDLSAGLVVKVDPPRQDLPAGSTLGARNFTSTPDPLMALAESAKNIAQKIDRFAESAPGARTAGQKADSSADLAPSAREAAAKVNIKKILFPGRTDSPQQTDLQAGLVSEEGTAHPSIERPSGIDSPPVALTDAPSSGASGARSGRLSAAGASAKVGQVSPADGTQAQAESTAPQVPVTAAQHPVRMGSTLITDLPPSSATTPPARESDSPVPGDSQPFIGPHLQPSPRQQAHPGLHSEHSSIRSNGPQSETPPDQAPNLEPEDIQYNTATRMSGLRNLIYSLGQRNLQKTQHAGQREAEAPAPSKPPEPPEPPEPLEPPHQRPAFARPQPPISQAAPRWADAEPPSPTLVTAPPEFLPPRPLAEKEEKGRSTSSHSHSRRDRSETYDDVEILPSWRGQYKRKG